MLRLTRIKRQNELRLYCFEEYSRPDYLARAVTLFVDAHFDIRSIHFNSSRYGTLKVSRDVGITESLSWEDDDEARMHSGTANYYSSVGVSRRPAVVDKVLDDIIAASPSEKFTEMIRGFVERFREKHAYDFFHYKLEPIRTTGQIHILRYVEPEKDDAPEPIDLKSPLLRIARNLNPIYVTTRSYQSILSSLNRIHYTCTSCGANNPLLQKRCKACGAARPPLKAHALLLFLIRAFIGMTYFLYAIATLVFILYTILHLKPN